MGGDPRADRRMYLRPRYMRIIAKVLPDALIPAINWRMKTARLPLLLLIVLLALSFRSFAAGDSYYLSLPGLTGESTAEGHQKQIGVTGFQYPGLSGSANSFYIQKGFDSASAGLLMASVSGTTFTTGTFYCEKGSSSSSLGAGAGKRIFSMVFGGLVVDSWESYDYGAAELTPAEKVSFTFSTLTITSYPQRKGDPTVVTPIFFPPMTN